VFEVYDFLRGTCADVGRDEGALSIPPTIDTSHGYIYVYIAQLDMTSALRQRRWRGTRFAIVIITYGKRVKPRDRREEWEKNGTCGEGESKMRVQSSIPEKQGNRDPLRAKLEKSGAESE
jgi:hypothetical protein